MERTEQIKNQIKAYKSRVEMNETGKVILVGDGIARVYGLKKCMAGELVEFEGGYFGMAQNLGLECIAEGVETAEQVTILKENNCYNAQGYLFDKPCKIEDFDGGYILKEDVVIKKVTVLE